MQEGREDEEKHIAKPVVQLTKIAAEKMRQEECQLTCG
jgi:hypothetical protein